MTLFRYYDTQSEAHLIYCNNRAKRISAWKREGAKKEVSVSGHFVCSEADTCTLGSLPPSPPEEG